MNQTTSTTRSATHAGHCQVCGSLQLLPAGRLSKHGYTVALGFFSGTCYGSNELPFEKDKSLVERSIADAGAQRVRIEAEIVELLKPVDGATAWAYCYRPATFERGKRHSSYEWHRVELTLTTRTSGEHTFTDITFVNPIRSAGERALQTLGRDYSVAGYPKTIADAALAMNARRVEFLRGQLKSIASYIAHQRDRIKNWAPTETMPRAKYPKL